MSGGVVEGNLLSGNVSGYKLAAQFLTRPAPKQEIMISPLPPFRALLKRSKKKDVYGFSMLHRMYSMMEHVCTCSNLEFLKVIESVF